MNPTSSPLPTGWKIVTASSSPSSQYLLQSPTGKLYPTYLAALRHLNYFDSNQTEIDVLRIGLVQEGWEAQAGLPKKWFSKDENGSLIFLSHDFLEFPTFASAYEYLVKNKSNFDPEELTTFQSTFSTQVPPTPPVVTKKQTVSWAPEKLSMTKANVLGKAAINGKRKYGVKGDQTFAKLKNLVENGGSKVEIDIAVSQLITEGWVTVKNLPKGWLRTSTQNKPTQYLVFDPFCAKFGSKYSAVGSLKRMGVEKQYIAKFVVSDTDVEHYVGNENDDDWVSGNETVPEGWKIRKQNNNPDPAAVEILSPYNICYRSRVDALKHMTMEVARELFTRDEVEQLRSLLVHEGWVDHTILPEGWKINRTQAWSSFLTKDCSIMKDYSSALKVIKDPKSRYTVHDKTNFLHAAESLKFNKNPVKLTPPVIVEVSRPKTLLPKGWKLENLTEKLIRITAADGTQFLSRLQALEYMIESGEDQELIYALWSTLEEEDWRFGYKFVPIGWGVREPASANEEFLFLTRELEVLVNVEQALDYIENDDAYTGEDYKMLKKWNDNFKGVTWVEDEDLPKGWKKTEDDEEDEQFLGPLGTIINGRVALIGHLINENHPPDDIFALWGTLDLEGWMNDNKNLPLGWKSKYFPELDEFHYLSPLMQVVKSDSDLVKLITDCKLTSPDEKLMVKHLKDWASNNYQ